IVGMDACGRGGGIDELDPAHRGGYLSGEHLSLFLLGLTVAHIVEVVGGLTVSERVAAVTAPGPEGMISLMSHGEFAQVEVVEPGAAVNHSCTSTRSHTTRSGSTMVTVPVDSSMVTAL